MTHQYGLQIPFLGNFLSKVHFTFLGVCVLVQFLEISVTTSRGSFFSGWVAVLV